MSELLQAAIHEIAPMVLGAAGTGVGWILKTVIKARKDLTAAHRKIRELESRIDKLEKKE